MTLDLRTTKLPAMQGALQQRANISRLYFRRKEERRMLISVEGTVRLKKRNLGSYLSQSKLDKLLKATWRNRNHVQLEHIRWLYGKNTSEDWSEKELHGYCIRQTNDEASECCSWLTVRTDHKKVKKETEELIRTALENQDQTMRTRLITARD